MQWVTRRHWFWGLILPARWYLLLAMLGLAGRLTDLWSIRAAAWLLGVAGMGFLMILIRWRNFTLSITPGERVLWERSGLLLTSERRVNLGLAGSIQFRQTPGGRMLDYGTISIVALGGPYEWGNMSGFETLRRIVENNEQR
jgi:hypothetical protein